MADLMTSFVVFVVVAVFCCSVVFVCRGDGDVPAPEHFFVITARQQRRPRRRRSPRFRVTPSAADSADDDWSESEKKKSRAGSFDIIDPVSAADGGLDPLPPSSSSDDDSDSEAFAPVAAVSQFPYPPAAVAAADQIVNLQTDAYASAYQGTQVPIGQPPLVSVFERSGIPLSNTLVSPRCCPSEFSSSEGCYCYGYPARWDFAERKAQR